MIVPRLVQVRHLVVAALKQAEVVRVTQQKGGRNVGRKTGLMEIDADRIGQPQMPDPVVGGGQATDRAMPKSQLIDIPVISVEDAPCPADHGVGMNVRRCRQPKLLRQFIANPVDGSQVVDPECIGRTHRCHDGRHSFSILQHPPQVLLECSDHHVAVGCRRNTDHVLFADAQPVGDGQAGVVGALRAENDGRFAASRTPAARAGLFQTDLNAVQRGTRSAKCEQPTRLLRVIAHQVGRHRDRFHLRDGDLSRRVVTAQVGIIDRRKQSADDAGDRRRRDDVDLRSRMRPDEHAREMINQSPCDVFE